MAKTIRQVVKIDEELCNGCGLCVPSCAEGAIQIIEGKAKMVSERYCDGLGACLGECPQGAITIETREAEDFDEAAAMEHVKKTQAPEAVPAHSHAAHAGHGHGHAGFVCPSARMLDRTHEQTNEDKSAAKGEVASELRQWPVKLYLVNPMAPYFEGADLIISADCVPFAYGSFHADFLKGKTLVTGCPKFDDTEVYLEKLKDICKLNNIKSLTVVKMEVPCCSGLVHLAQMAITASGKEVPMEVVTVSLTGEIKSAAPVNA